MAWELNQQQPDPAFRNQQQSRYDMGQLTIECETGAVSDGYHTFDELYAHRCALFVALMAASPDIAWASPLHSDGTGIRGWIIAGMDLPTGMITYHLPTSFDTLLLDAGVRILERAPAWDGHTSADVVERLTAWVRTRNSQIIAEKVPHADS
jgi:hypothetical protein